MVAAVLESEFSQLRGDVEVNEGAVFRFLDALAEDAGGGDGGCGGGVETVDVGCTGDVEDVEVAVLR